MNDLAKSPIPLTAGLNELYQDDGFVKRIAVVREDLSKVLYETSKAAVREDNMEKIGPTILAIHDIESIILLFAARGDVLRANEDKTPRK